MWVCGRSPRQCAAWAPQAAARARAWPGAADGPLWPMRITAPASGTKARLTACGSRTIRRPALHPRLGLPMRRARCALTLRPGIRHGRAAQHTLWFTALDMAAATRGTFPAGVVLHADRGAQFTSQHLAAYMRAVEGTVWMGRAQVCWDNAMAESFWATLTTESCYRRAFTTRDQVDTGVATWIEDFYNRRRMHTSLGGRSPIEDERHQAAWTTAAETNRQQLTHRPTAPTLTPSPTSRATDREQPSATAPPQKHSTNLLLPPIDTAPL